MSARPKDAWLTVEAVCEATGACVGGARAWRARNAPNATALPVDVARRNAVETGDEEYVIRAADQAGYGDGYGNGYGNGDGDGDGNGYGNGYGDGDGDGNGYGNGYGDGDGGSVEEDD